MKTTLRLLQLHRAMKGSVARYWIALALALLGAASAGRATIILDLPDLVLQPNLAEQTFTFSVQNDAASVALSGVQLELIVGDGDAAVGGSGGAPAIRAVSLISAGLLFADNHTGDRGEGNFADGFPPNGLDQVFQRLTSTAGGTVSLDPGTFDLATVTFDTTGIAPGDYAWSAAFSPNGSSFFTGTAGAIEPTLLGGTLTVVPEPATYMVGMFALCVLTVAWLRRCRAEDR